MSRIAYALAFVAVTAAPAIAQQPEEPERCPRFVAELAPAFPLERVSFVRVQVASREVQLTYVGHSTFLIESPAGITIATDYNGEVRPSVVPLVATMNRAHTTHYTLSPDPGIKHVLRGWGEDGRPANYKLTIDDVWIRNVTTNIRTEMGGGRDQNSIFVFEVAGICIAHLGHLHHKLTPDHLRALGRIDVVLTPVDRGLTLNVEEMIDVLKSIGAPLVIPMHFFSESSLDVFLGRLGQSYVIQRNDSPRLTLTRESLPRKPTVIVLPGY